MHTWPQALLCHLEIQSLHIECQTAQIHDFEHSILNLGYECRQGLLRAFPNAEELIVCNKVTAGLLLDKDYLESILGLCWVILVCLDMNLLV